MSQVKKKYKISLTEDEMKFLQSNIRYLAGQSAHDSCEASAQIMLCDILNSLTVAKKVK